MLLRNHYQQVNCRIHGKIANIKPLFKKCCKTDKKNYRQISLRSLVCKLTGKIVKSRAMKFWRNIHIPFPNRFGSMAGRSTPSELLSCYDDWTKWRDGRKPTGIVFLDFSTSSDSVPHERLLFKQERQLALTAVFFSACSFLLTACSDSSCVVYARYGLLFHREYPGEQFSDSWNKCHMFSSKTNFYLADTSY